MKTEIANKIEAMIRNEKKHLDWLKSNNAPQEFIELSKWHIIHYTERLKEYRESLATTQKEWKTFLIETLSQKTDVPYRFFSQYYSMEDAREHHKRAISITEVKLNIEPVNSASQNTEKQECDTPCGMNYCDENGCTNRKRNLVEPIELPKETTVSNEVYCNCKVGKCEGKEQSKL